MPPAIDPALIERGHRYRRRGEIYYKKENYVEAEKRFRRALSCFEQTLGSSDSDFVITASWLSAALEAQQIHEAGKTRIASGEERLLDATSDQSLTAIWDPSVESDDEIINPPNSITTPPWLSVFVDGHALPIETDGMTLPSVDRLGALFREKGRRSSYNDSEICEVSSILEQLNPRWSKVPRLYIVLRTINQLDRLDEFIELGFSDYWLPITQQALPYSLPNSCHVEFMEAQQLILTKSIGLEKGKDGRHCHFTKGEPLPFKKVKRLGSGRFGQVDKITSVLSYREYALKRVKRADAFQGQRSEVITQFISEIETLKRIKHRHVVEFVGSYTDHKYIGLLMLPVADMDLAVYLSVINESRRERLRSFFGCLARALEFLHDQNIRHKDIKPSNILIHNGDVKFTDFGLSLDFTDASGSTTIGMVNGFSWKFCAPEVAAYAPRNRASDIWSLGVVFLEMLTVLKGKTVDYIETFIITHGSRKRFVHQNPRAVNNLIEVLKLKGQAADNRVTTWIKSMLSIDQHLRPGAAELVSSISGYQLGSQQRTMFCGDCCISIDISSSESDNEPYSPPGMPLSRSP